MQGVGGGGLTMEEGVDDEENGIDKCSIQRGWQG